MIGTPESIKIAAAIITNTGDRPINAIVAIVTSIHRFRLLRHHLDSHVRFGSTWLSGIAGVFLMLSCADRDGPAAVCNILLNGRDDPHYIAFGHIGVDGKR